MEIYKGWVYNKVLFLVPELNMDICKGLLLHKVLIFSTWTENGYL